jgi:hypothetical protein
MFETVFSMVRLSGVCATLLLVSAVTPCSWAQRALVASGEPQESELSESNSETAMVAGPDLTGTWAQMLVTTTSSRVPVLGEVRSTTSALLLMHVVQDGHELAITRQVCAIDVNTGATVVRTEVPAAFVRAIPVSRERARLMETASGHTVAGWRFSELVGLRGVSASESMPESDDERYVDADHDGNPGVTVRVRGLVNGEVYVAQRGVTEFRPTTVTPNAIDGEVDWTAEQVVLGASNRLLRNENPNTAPAPGYAGNYFRTERVAESSTCSSLQSDSRRLFGFEF